MLKSFPLINNVAKRTMATTAESSVAPSSIYAGLILSRIPIVTPDLTEFEESYYKYNEELERRLMWTFPKYYYFKKGTVAERLFAASQRYPTPKRSGVWFPKGIPELRHGRDRRYKEDIVLPKSDETKSDDPLAENSERVKYNPRITEADKSNDTKSIERKLPRTLYLLVEEGKNNWRFPRFNLESFETPLHKVAEEGLREIGGTAINTWTVSNSPTAVLKYQENSLLDPYEHNDNDITSREFLIKSHIIAGKFDLQNNSSYQNYQWLVKEEIEALVTKDYYNQIEHLLSNV